MNAPPREELIVNEMFGPTFQGEGPSTGRRCCFLRLGLCNLSCGAGPNAAWACDTPFTWDWTGKLGKVWDKNLETRRMHYSIVVDQLKAYDTPLVVVSGGEPMLQAVALRPLILALRALGMSVEIETNGTLPPTAIGGFARFNVSPKLSSSGMAPQLAIRHDRLEQYRDLGAAFKFVIARLSDFVEVDALAAQLDLNPAQVWVMPAGTTIDDIHARLPWIAERALLRGFNLSTRLHVDIWQDERAR